MSKQIGRGIYLLPSPADWSIIQIVGRDMKRAL